MPSTAPYRAEPDLSLASTLPSSWYVDPARLEIERERVFGRTWQWVSRTAALAEPGDYVSVDLLGEPLLLARDEAGELRGYFNVCRHRAGPVASGEGNRRLFQCGYHGWTYGLDGRLKKAPEMDGVQGFRERDVCLEGVAVAEWPPLVFANLSATPSPLEALLGEIETAVSRAGLERDRLRLVERRDYVVEANWKTYVDNYLEGYHIPIVHPGLFREVDYERYRVETFRYYSEQIAPLRPGRSAKGADRTYEPRGGDDRALYYWVFPNLMLNFYPGNLQVNGVFPLGPERTLTVFEWYGTNGERTEVLEKAIAFGDRVQREDMDICARVQKGLRSRSYDRGRFSVRRENGVHHFHLLLAESLSASE